MNQLNALPILLQELHRILSRMDNPIDVHLDAHILSFCLSHHQVKQRSVAVRQKLITVCVIEKLDPMFRKRFTSAIEDCRRFAGSFFVKRIVVWNPRATAILDPKQLCLTGDLIKVIAALFIRKMCADSFEPVRVKLFFELLRRDAVSARQLNVRDAKGTHLVQRARNILLELLAQAVKLKTNRPFET